MEVEPFHLWEMDYIVSKMLCTDIISCSCYKTEAGEPKKAGPIFNATPGMLGGNSISLLEPQKIKCFVT